MPNEKESSAVFSRGPATLTPVDTVLKSRYECKYLIHPRLAEPIRNYMRPYVQPDKHAKSRPGYRYPICSLYLDSPTLDLYEATVRGDKNRFKLRIRTYGDGPEQPVFFEIKKRMDGIVYKRRCKRTRDDTAAFFEACRTRAPAVPRGANPDLEEFSRLLTARQAMPVMRVKYMREAYESVARDPVRITFDTDLVSALTYDGTLYHSGSGWVPTPLEGIVLELKFTERFPPWVGEMIKCFELRRCSVAKYVRSVDKALAEGRCGRPLRAAGVPPGS